MYYVCRVCLTRIYSFSYGDNGCQCDSYACMRCRSLCAGCGQWACYHCNLITKRCFLCTEDYCSACAEGGCCGGCFVECQVAVAWCCQNIQRTCLVPLCDLVEKILLQRHVVDGADNRPRRPRPLAENIK